ncbi:hypothetical protein WK70_18045 [Burkholderia cepacia]|nr:hypothetical protein WK70_18045 [Burkholderia cepacia]
MGRVACLVPEHLDHQVFEHSTLIAVEMAHDAHQDIFARALQALYFPSAAGSQRERDGTFIDTGSFFNEASIDQAGYGAHSCRMR